MAPHFIYIPSAAAGTPFTNTYSMDLNNGATTDEYVDFGDVLNFGVSDPFTVMAWVKFDEVTTVLQTICGKRATGGGAGWVFATGNTGNTDHIFIIVHDGNGYIQVTCTNTALATGSWCHLAAAYNGDATVTNMKIWINGAPKAVEVFDSGAFDTDMTNESPFRIGKIEFTSYNDFSGVIGDVVVLPKMCSNDEIAEIYNSGSEFDMTTFSDWANLKSSSQCLWVNWEADTFESGSQPGVTDLSDNGRTGTATNMSDATNKVEDAPPTP